MALKDIILPITEFGQGNIGVKDINIDLVIRIPQI